MAEMFYVVWHECGGVPVYRHDHQPDAEREAQRLAQSSPGDRFYVLAAIKSVRVHSPVEWETLSDVPF